MKEIYPSHYAAFHCIAGACPDSCCKEWEIVAMDGLRIDSIRVRDAGGRASRED